jgi:hypothetical protein
MYVVQTKSTTDAPRTWNNYLVSSDVKTAEEAFTKLVRDRLVGNMGFISVTRLVHTGPLPDLTIRNVIHYQEFT